MTEPLDKELIRKGNAWLNEHGEPSEQELDRLVHAHTPEAGETLQQIADQYDIPVDESTDPATLVQLIRQKMEEGEDDYHQSSLT